MTTKQGRWDQGRDDLEDGDDLVAIIRCSNRRVLAVVNREGSTLLFGTRGTKQAKAMQDSKFPTRVQASSTWGDPPAQTYTVLCGAHAGGHTIDPVKLSNLISGRRGRKTMNVDIGRVAFE